MDNKRILTLSIISLFIFAFLWVGHSTFTSAANLLSEDAIVSAPQQNKNFTAMLSNTSILTETFKITSPMPITGARFGWNTVIDNNLIIVGEPDQFPGHLYIYEKDSGGFNNWGVTKIITPSDHSAGQAMGVTVRLDGDTILTGAPLGDVNATASGAAFIFERNEGGTNNWGEVAKLFAPDGGNNERFGWSLDLDGDTAVIGAKSHNHSGSTTGAVYVFERNHGGLNNWGLVKEFSASNSTSFDAYGFSVAIDKDTLVVGADAQDTNAYQGGLAYIYERNEGGPNNWGEVAIISPNSPLSQDLFGSAAAIEGDLIAIGSRQEGTSRPGAVHLFGRNIGGTNNWGQITKLTPSDGQANNQFGRALSLKGDTLLVGGYHSPGVVNNSGAVYLFKQDEIDPTQWNEVQKFVASDGQSDDQFSRGISFSGNTFVIGAIHQDGYCQSDPNCNSGAVYIYTPFYQVYLPTILSTTTASFPIHIGDPVQGQAINQGEVFYTATVAIPGSIPTTGQFFLSADSGYISKIGVDDELAIVLDGNEIFVKTFALNGSTIHHEIVEVPRNVMEQMAGQTVSVIYRDVYGQQASASQVWLIWVP